MNLAELLPRFFSPSLCDLVGLNGFAVIDDDNVDDNGDF